MFVNPAHIAESSPWGGVSSAFNIVESYLFARKPFKNTTFGFAFGFSENLFARKTLTKYDFRVCVRVFRKPLSKEAPYKIRLSG